MLPILLDLKIIRIYTIGVFLVLAFFWGSYWLWRNIKLTSYKEEDIFDGLFITLFGAFLSARLLFIALHFEDFGFNFLKFILINGFPGLSILGALIGGGFTLYLYTRARKINFREMVDYIVGPLFLALAIGKIGSFFGGTDVGTKTAFFLRVNYVGHEGAGHIVAVYEAVLFFMAFIVSQRLLFKIRRGEAAPATAGYFFLIFFCLTQIILDNIKVNRLYLADLPFDIVVNGLVLLVTSAILLFNNRRLMVAIAKKPGRIFRQHGTKKSHQKTD